MIGFIPTMFLVDHLRQYFAISKLLHITYQEGKISLLKNVLPHFDQTKSCKEGMVGD